MQILSRSSLAVLAVTCLTLGASAQQITVTLEPHQDNTMFDWDPNLSNGAGSRIFCGNDFAAGTRRALLAFDVAGPVPRGSTIVSATLDMTIAQTMAADLAVDLHRLTTDWGEGASVATGGQGGGAPALPGDTTWDKAVYPNTPWQAVGGDFVATPSATRVCRQTGTFTWSSTQLTADAQSWLDAPTSAFGWIARTQETGVQTARAFHSREALTPAERPHLVIVYTPPSAQTQSFGSGCTGGGTQPLTVGTNSLPTVPNPGFAVTLTGGPATGLKAIDYFRSLLPTGLPLGSGCFLWGDFTTFVDGVLVTTGSAPLAIPNDTNLLGVRLAVQGLAFDPTASRLATSNGLLLQLGR